MKKIKKSSSECCSNSHLSMLKNKKSCKTVKCAEIKHKSSWFMKITFFTILFFYLLEIFRPQILMQYNFFDHFAISVFETINKMWIGITMGIIMVSIISKGPRELLVKVLGTGEGIGGIIRASLAGVLLDLCSHGILLVAGQLYKKGLSLGQVIAFLIASPWNSISLTFILWSLIGLKWTLTLLVLSMIVAITSGIIIHLFVKKGILPKNPNTIKLDENFNAKKALLDLVKSAKFDFKSIKNFFLGGVRQSEMILKWIFFGILLACLVRVAVSYEYFVYIFGPTWKGMAMTLGVATLLEVCSEGSVPLAADILVRAKAVGNSFIFLMAGVSTDFTEIIVLKETTKSWKIAFFLPLVTVPQIVVIGYILNKFS